MKEIWKDIKGYEKLYEVSNLGRIKSKCKNTKNQHAYQEIILQNIYDKDGYCMEYKELAKCMNKLGL